MCRLMCAIPVPVPITQIKFSSSGDQIFTAALDGTFTQWTHFLEPVNVYPAECRSVPFLHIGDNYQDRFRRHKLTLCRTLFAPPHSPAPTTGQQGPAPDGREGSSQEQKHTSGSQQLPAAETAVDGELQLETLEVEEAKDGEAVGGADNEQALQANAAAVDAMSAAAVEGEQAAFDAGLSQDDVEEVNRQAAGLAEAEASKADDAADTAAQKAIDLDDLFLSQLRAPNQAKGAVMSFAVSRDGVRACLHLQLLHPKSISSPNHLFITESLVPCFTHHVWYPLSSDWISHLLSMTASFAPYYSYS